MHKIIFKNSETGTPEDWTKYLSDMSSISRRVESENAGEAGVIVYDNVSFEFEYKTGTPVYDAFNGNLSSIQRYIIEVYGIKTTGQEIKMFEGLVNFSSLEWPDLSKKVSFEVLDKLSALDIIASELPRTESTLNSRILSQLPSAISLRSALLPTPYTFPSNCYELLIYAKNGNSDTLDFTEVIVHPGEYIQDPQTWGSEAKYYYVKSSYLELDDNNNMVNHIVLATSLYAEHDYLPLNTVEYLSNNSTHYLSKEFYGIDINIISGGDSQALDALKIIEAIFRKAWSTTPIINKTVNSTYPIPLEYAAKLIDENPFGKHPLDALKMLADSMQCYIFINRLGELVIQQKSLLATNGTTRTIDDLKKKDGRKKYFWDKLADEIEITVNSWVVDEETGDYLQGVNSVSKNPKIKARNSISKEVLVIEDDGTPSTQDELNAIAATKATEYFNFYGRRHFAYPISLNLYDEILDWDLLDNITIDAEKYFFETLDIDPLEMTVDLELVSVNAYDYDSKQAHVIIGEGNESSYSSSGSSSSSSYSAPSTIVLNKKLTNLSQMDNNPGLVVQVSDYGFAKRLVIGTANQVNVTNGNGVSGDIAISLPQDIHAAAVPTFAGTKLTSLTPNRVVSVDANNNLVSTNLSSWITGTPNRVSVTDDLDGSVTLSLPQDIHTAAVPTFAGAVLNGNVSISGNLTVSNLTANRLIYANGSKNLVSTNLSSWIAGTFNRVSVTDDLDGSVTLSLPQDIHTSATVQFGTLGLGSANNSGYISTFNDAGIIGSKTFVDGWSGSGWKLNYADGEYDFTIDNMTVRGTLAIYELLINQIRATNGNLLVTSVAKVDSFVADDGTSHPYDEIIFEDVTGHGVTPFAVGDIIMCQVVDTSGVTFDGNNDVVNTSALVKRLIYEVITINPTGTNLLGIKIEQVINAPTNKGIPKSGDAFVRIGSTSDINRRGSIGLYADEKNSPYIQVKAEVNSWTAWKSQASVKVQMGNLAGLTDSNFGGALTGYGLYAVDNVYIKGMLYANTGSNIAGWITTSNQFASPEIRVGLTNVYAKTYIDASSSKIGLHVNLNDSTNTNDEWISVGSILDKDGVVEAGKFGISYKSYLGNYFELTNTSRNIAGWNFDTTKFSKGNARLEASASINGLVISKNGADCVRVGDFNYTTLAYSIRNITDTYIGYVGIDYLNDVSTTPYTDVTKWNTGGWITSQDDGFNGANNTISIYGALDGQTHQIMRQSRDRVYWWNYVLQRRLTYSGGGEPLQKLMGHRNRINYKLIFADHNEQGQEDGGQLDVYIRYFDASDNLVQHILLESIAVPNTTYPGTYVVDRTGAGASEIDFPFNANAEYGVLFFAFSGGGQGTVEYAPLLMVIQEFSIYGYDLYYSALNASGLEIYNSPTNYFKFGNDLAEISATDVRVAGLRVMRFHGVVTGFPTVNVQVGDTCIINEVTYVCHKINIAGEAEWKQISSSAVSGAYGMSELSNTNINTLSAGQILKYDGTNWINSTVAGGAGSLVDADLLDSQHGAYYLDWNNTTSKPSPTITLGNHATGSLTLTNLAGGTLNVTVVNDSHTHDTRYFTETEITTNYYDKTYINSNFTTTTNQYGKWVVSDGTNTYNVVKDATIPFTGTGGVSTLLTGNSMVISIATNTFATYNHNHSAVYAPIVHSHNDLYYTETESDAKYSILTHVHDDRYFTETEITTNYYDKTYINTNFTTTTNQYSKWVLTAGAVSNNIVKDQAVTFSGANGVTCTLANFIMTVGITANTYALYSHSHDDRYFTETEITTNYYSKTNLDSGQLDNRYYTKTLLDGGQLDSRYFTETEIGTNFYTKAQLNAGQLNSIYFTETEITTNYYSKTQLDAGQLDTRYFTETEIGTNFYTKVQLDAGQLDTRYYTETEADAKFMGNAGGDFTGNVTIGTGTDVANRFLKVITGDANIAGVYAVGNNSGHGDVFVGKNINYGGGMFFKGSANITNPRTVGAVSFYRKNYTAEAEVFYYDVLTEGVHFQEEIYSKGITASQRIVSSVATGTAPLTIASTTLVNNLNADLWDGYQFSSYLDQAVRTSDSPTFSKLTSTTATGTAPFTVASTTLVNNLNADLLDGVHLSGLVQTSRQIFAGNGLTGGGTLSSDVTLTLGTPETLSNVTANGVTSTSHSHAITNYGMSGTANQITISGLGRVLGAEIILSLPQNIHTGATPQFAGLTLTGDLVQTGNVELYNNYTSGILGAGFSIGQTTNGSVLEIDNITVRNALRTHIFQKDVVKTVNGYLLISDAGVIVSATSGTVTFRDDKSASLEGRARYVDENGDYYVDENDDYYVDKNIEDGTEMWVKDANSATGEIVSVKFYVGAILETGGVGSEAYTTYEVEFIEGSYDLLQPGMTAARTSGGTILIDASSTNSPFIDVSDGTSVRARFGNLSGLSKTVNGVAVSGYGLWSDNVFLEGGIIATFGKVGNWTISETTLSNGMNITLDASLSKISINSPIWGAKGIQLEYNSGNPRAYIGNGSNRFFNYDGTNISWASANTSLSTTGKLTTTSATIGSWEVNGVALFNGTDIVLDATNKRISLNNNAMAFGYGIGGTGKHGIFLDADNFWYSDKTFKMGGTNGITFNGTDLITIGSNTVFLGDLTGNTITGTDLVVDVDGGIKSSNYVAGEVGWKLSGDGFENNDMRQFELLEDIDAGTPVKIVYDGTTARVAKLKESNLEALNDNEIYSDATVFSQTLSSNNPMGANNYRIRLNNSQVVFINYAYVDPWYGSNFTVVTANADGSNISSMTETYYVPDSTSPGSGATISMLQMKIIKLSDSTLLLKINTQWDYLAQTYFGYSLGIITVSSNGGVVISNVSTPIFDSGYSSDVYKVGGSNLDPESIDSTHVMLMGVSKVIKINADGSYSIQLFNPGTDSSFMRGGFKTSDGKLVYATTYSGYARKIRLYSISGDTISYVDTPITRTDISNYPSMYRQKEDLFCYTFTKSSDGSYGIGIITYSNGTIYEGDGVLPGVTVASSVFPMNDFSGILGGYPYRIVGSTVFFDFKVKGFSTAPTLMIGNFGNSDNILWVDSNYVTVSAKVAKIKKVLSTADIYYPTFINKEFNRPLRLYHGSIGIASDFCRLNTEKYALVRHENFGTAYLMFTIVERLADGYAYYSDDFIIATVSAVYPSTIKVISDNYFLVKNGSYIYLIKLVGTTLSLVDSYYNSAITSYNQDFAELVKGSKYVFMGASVAIILDVDTATDNLTGTSYATTTSTLINNIVELNENQWVGAYPFNSSGYKATYRTYTFTGSAVTYSDLVNTTLVSSTAKIALAHVRANIVLVLSILSTGNGSVSLEELYSAFAATIDSREYPSALFPSIDGLKRINSEGFGGILGDNIVHIVVSSGKINTRFASNLIESGITVETRKITSASNGDMILYVKGDFIEDNASGGMDAIAIDIVNDSYYVDGILEQTGLAGETKKVAMIGDETSAFTGMIPGTRYGINFDYPTDIVENYDKEILLAVETDKAKITI